MNYKIKKMSGNKKLINIINHEMSFLNTLLQKLKKLNFDK